MSVIKIPRLPDQLTLDFGPIEPLARFILRADRLLRDSGIRLSLSTDFAELWEINARAKGKDWYTLPPMFDQTFNELGPKNGFWLKGVNHAGETVLSHAVRLYVWADTDLRRETESLRLLYGPTVVDLAGARGEATAASASMLTGRIAHTGALWIRSDFRNKGLARTVSPLTRALTLSRWYPEAIFGLVSRKTVEAGMAAVYGWPESRVERSIVFSALPGFESRLEFCLCWMTTEEVEAAVIAAVPEVASETRPMHSMALS